MRVHPKGEAAAELFSGIFWPKKGLELLFLGCLNPATAGFRIIKYKMNQSSTIFLAILFGLCGLAIVIFVIKVLVEAIFGDMRGLGTRLKLSAGKKALDEVDELLKTKPLSNPSQIIIRLRESFLLDHFPVSELLIDKIHNHNQELLGRVVSVSEHFSVRLSSLGTVEQLLIDRAELMKLILETSNAQKKLHQRRKEKGMETKSWALGEFEKKMEEMRSDLATNRNALQRTLEELFEQCKQFGNNDEITYH